MRIVMVGMIVVIMVNYTYITFKTGQLATLDWDTLVAIAIPVLGKVMQKPFEKKV